MDARTWIKQKVGIQLFIPPPSNSSRQGAVREEAVYLVDRICGSQAVRSSLQVETIWEVTYPP